MKFILVTVVCFVLVALLGTAEVGGESCLPPGGSLDIYTEVDRNDPRVQDFAKFAAKKMNSKLISVTCAGELKVRMFKHGLILTVKLIVEFGISL